MRNITLILIFLTSTNIFAQEKKEIFKPELEKYVLQCENIGRTITDKNILSDLNKWYDGTDKENAISEIKKLESNIDKSELDATYYLTMMNENPLIYSYHFYNKETKTEFGQLFIRFKDRENNLVDDIKFVSKAQMEEINAESKKSSGTMNIPPPPPPPVGKKKNGN
jgi:hypothetical protein